MPGAIAVAWAFDETISTARGRMSQQPTDDESVREAYAAWEVEDWRRVAELLEAAVRRDPDGPHSQAYWFDAALAYKFLRNWPKAYELGREAARRAPRNEQDPAYWNLGIAATVLRDWVTARDAWLGYGVPLPPGEGEIVEDFGVACLRIETREGQEVVWARRLCPTRARVVSVPFDLTRRFGEVVLHDGAPNGERYVDGRRYPVFDEIALFTPSEVATLSATVTGSTSGDLDALLGSFTDRDLGAELVGSGQMLCKCCSEGAQQVNRHVPVGRHTVLLGAPERRARALLDAWRAADPARREWADLHVAAS
jgi:hypothetical protein